MKFFCLFSCCFKVHGYSLHLHVWHFVRCFWVKRSCSSSSITSICINNEQLSFFLSQCWNMQSKSNTMVNIINRNIYLFQPAIASLFFFSTLDKQSTMCLLRLVLISLNGIGKSTFIPADTENKPTVHSACKPLWNPRLFVLWLF